MKEEFHTAFLYIHFWRSFGKLMMTKLLCLKEDQSF